MNVRGRRRDKYDLQLKTDKWIIFISIDNEIMAQEFHDFHVGIHFCSAMVFECKFEK